MFSPYKYGGIEIKATCGSTPSASHVAKPAIGDQRIHLVNKFDWKVHHAMSRSRNKWFINFKVFFIFNICFFPIPLLDIPWQGGVAIIKNGFFYIYFDNT